MFWSPNVMLSLSLISHKVNSLILASWLLGSLLCWILKAFLDGCIALFFKKATFYEHTRSPGIQNYRAFVELYLPAFPSHKSPFWNNAFLTIQHKYCVLFLLLLCMYGFCNILPSSIYTAFILCWYDNACLQPNTSLVCICMEKRKSRCHRIAQRTSGLMLCILKYRNYKCRSVRCSWKS